MLVIIMGKKKNNKNQSNNFPFSNEIKKAKDEFKRMIDEMSDEEFMDFTFMLMLYSEDFEADEFEEEYWSDDEGWEDAAKKFYHNNENNVYDFPKTEKDDSLPF